MHTTTTSESDSFFHIPLYTGAKPELEGYILGALQYSPFYSSKLEVVA